ncbi:MAG: GerW family sporulation protein [Stellaceae bacterium]
MTLKVAKTLRSLGERLKAGASVRQVYGDPIEFGGRMVVPIARLRYGFGVGGAMEGRGKARSGHGGGSGGGAGISVRPVGAIEITGAGTRFIRFTDPAPLGLALLIGFLVGLRTGRRSRRG